MAERLQFDKNASKHVQAYLEYKQQQNFLMGDADHGVTFTPEQYEKYKRKMLKSSKNRIYTQWVNSKGRQCKFINSASRCFCGHRYGQHNYQNPKKSHQVKCTEKKCPCRQFEYIPVWGSHDFKCTQCKHSYDEHSVKTRKCRKKGCKKCTGFISKWSCGCKEQYDMHSMNFETREERIDAGKPVDDLSHLEDPEQQQVALLRQVVGEKKDFISLMNGPEGYSNQIDQLGGQPQQKQIVQDFGEELFEDDEDFNYQQPQKKKRKQQKQQQNFEDEYENFDNFIEPGNSKTPHSLKKVKISNQYNKKYKY